MSGINYQTVRPIVQEIVNVRDADKARNEMQLENQVPKHAPGYPFLQGAHTDTQQIVVDPETRQSLGKQDVALTIKSDGIAPGSCNAVSGVCLNTVSAFLLSEGIPAIRPSFGVNRYARFK